jgi:hypothetical protein
MTHKQPEQPSTTLSADAKGRRSVHRWLLWTPVRTRSRRQNSASTTVPTQRVFLRSNSTHDSAHAKGAQAPSAAVDEAIDDLINSLSNPRRPVTPAQALSPPVAAPHWQRIRRSLRVPMDSVSHVDPKSASLSFQRDTQRLRGSATGGSATGGSEGDGSPAPATEPVRREVKKSTSARACAPVRRQGQEVHQHPRLRLYEQGHSPPATCTCACANEVKKSTSAA